MERARLTHKLARMKEEEGKIDEAAKILQELQVRKKINFIKGLIIIKSVLFYYLND